MTKIFIDGSSGTTGLQIQRRLEIRDDIQLLEIPENQRKDDDIKKDYLNAADIVILCLPDDSARESVRLIDNPDVKVLDASTAHRVDDNWVYGLPELQKNQREAIASAKRVSNPGCYPTGFILALKPLVDQGVIPADYPITVNAISGYSGGGRKLIDKYEQHSQETVEDPWVFRPYALGLAHKHLPEMEKYTGISNTPLFVPAVGNFERGMLVMIPLLFDFIKEGSRLSLIADVLKETYRDEPFIRVFPHNSQDALVDGFLSPLDCNGSNRVDLLLFGNDNQAVLTARLDNLGKGASGAAVQNLNIMMQADEGKSLLQPAQ